MENSETVVDRFWMVCYFIENSLMLPLEALRRFSDRWRSDLEVEVYVSVNLDRKLWSSA
jgi:hypothetical protein